MIDASLALQQTIRARLIADPEIAALVPADNVLDRGARPERFPAIIIGEGQTIHSDEYARFYESVYADLHIWAEEPGLTIAKAIAGAVRAALRRPPWGVQDHRCHALTIASSRFLRDPGGAHSHAIVTLEAILQEVAL